MSTAVIITVTWSSVRLITASVNSPRTSTNSPPSFFSDLTSPSPKCQRSYCEESCKSDLFAWRARHCVHEVHDVESWNDPVERRRSVLYLFWHPPASWYRCIHPRWVVHWWASQKHTTAGRWRQISSIETSVSSPIQFKTLGKLHLLFYVEDVNEKGTVTHNS